MKKQIQFHIGCSGYYNRHWKPIFYPEKLPQRLWLNFYSERFTTLEINSTFYKFPSTESLQVWYNKCPDDFILTVKAPKIITHFKKFNDCKRLAEDFYLACSQGLQHKLGAVLFQLPPSVHYSTEKLQLIIDTLQPGFKNVVEFRHKSWWSKKVYDVLAEKNITFCSVSHPKVPSTIIANTSIAYLRLHGNPKIFYSEYLNEELNHLYKSVLKKKKIKEIFVYFNNTASTAGILNAQLFKQMHNQ